MTDPLTLTGLDGAPNIAVDIAPAGVEGEFSLDTSEVGGVDLLGWGEDGWLNVVCDVTRLRMRRGATRMQGVLTRSEAAAVSVDVLDVGRRFDPLLNADVVHAGTPIRLRAWSDEPEPWSVVLFTGELEDVPVQYVHDGAPRVTLHASDVIAELSAWRSAGRPPPGVGAGDDLLERVTRVLDEVGFGELDLEVDEVYETTHPSTTLEAGWQVIVDAADAELGRVWITAAGRIVVRARGSELWGTIRGTLSDWHGETVAEPHVCYADLNAALGTEVLINRTIGERRVPQPAEGDPPATAGAVVQRDDTYSQARHRVRVQGGEQRNLDLETDGQVADWCEAVLIASSLPDLRIDSVQPAPWSAGPEAWRAVCETDIGDRWYLRYHPQIGPSVARMVGVLGIDLEVEPTGWSITWATAAATTPGENPTGWFAVDVSDLESGDVLAPFGGPVPALEAAP